MVATAIDGADAQSLREAVDSLKGRLGSAVIVLGTVTEDGKVSLVAGVTADLTQKIRAGDLVGEIAKMVGGRGGGRPDFAQAGGTDPSRARSRARGCRAAGRRKARRNLTAARSEVVGVSCARSSRCLLRCCSD